MNAYELAQCLEDMADFDGCEYQQSANMLRQQADRIAELEKKTKPLSDGEIDEVSKAIWERPWLEKHREFARAIEERHGIK